MKTNASITTTLLVFVTLAGAGKTCWSDGSILDDAIPSCRQAAESSEAPLEDGPERSPMSLMQVALAVERKSHNTENWSEQRQDTLSENVSQQSFPAAEEAVASMSKASSVAANIAAKTASKALADAPNKLERASTQQAKAVENALSESSLRLRDASDHTTPHDAAGELVHTQGHAGGNQTHAKAAKYLTMRSNGVGNETMPHTTYIHEGNHPVHPLWVASMWWALHFCKELITEETFALRLAILMACLAAVKVLHHTLENWAEWSQWRAKRVEANVAKVKLCSRKKPASRGEEFTSQLLASGREFFDCELHPDHIDLFQPSLFHEDIDARRAVKGGE